jgi:hypothetical protein
MSTPCENCGQHEATNTINVNGVPQKWCDLCFNGDDFDERSLLKGEGFSELNSPPPGADTWTISCKTFWIEDGQIVRDDESCWPATEENIDMLNRGVEL